MGASAWSVPRYVHVCLLGRNNSAFCARAARAPVLLVLAIPRYTSHFSSYKNLINSSNISYDMSEPTASLSPREQMAREIRKENMDIIIQAIKEDFQAETNPVRKENIAACLAEAEKNGTYVSSSQTLFATSGKAYVVPHVEFDQKWATLDAHQKRLVYDRVNSSS